MNTFCSAAAYLGISSRHCPSDRFVTNEVEQTFIEHITSHGLSYGTVEEYKFRLGIFNKADQEIREINANPENTFTVGHNFLSTWTESEYKRILGGMPQGDEPRNVTILDESNLESNVDWRSKGKVNRIQDQRSCGSCWAFAATAAFESAHAIKTGKLQKFAEQQLVDCDTTSHGCNGGWSTHAFNYLEKHYFELESEYKYTAKTGKCHYK
jgi:hypothetical protein